MEQLDNTLHSTFRSLSTTTLSTTLNRMEDVNVWSTGLTKSQVIDLFEKMSAETNLRSLNIGANTLISVPANTLGTALSKLTDIRVDTTYLRPMQTDSFFNQLTKKTLLKRLDMNNNNLSEVNEEVFSMNINKVQEVDLSQTKLTKEQLKELFKKMIEKTNLRMLKINDVDLSSVPANILAEALNLVQEIEISKCSLTIYQGIYLFSKMAEKTKIEKLKIDNNDLSLVPVEYLPKGANKVSEIDLGGTKLTDIQMTALFIEMLEETKIQKIVLDGNVETGYKDFVNSLRDRVNVIVTFDRSHTTTTIHLFKKF